MFAVVVLVQPQHCVTESTVAREAEHHCETREDEPCDSGNSKRSFFEFVFSLEILQILL